MEAESKEDKTKSKKKTDNFSRSLNEKITTATYCLTQQMVVLTTIQESKHVCHTHQNDHSLN